MDNKVSKDRAANMTKNLFENSRQGGLINAISSVSFDDNPEKENWPKSLSDNEQSVSEEGIVRDFLPEVSCPFLGSIEDPETKVGFPSSRNRCFRSERPLILTKGWQSDYCLCRDYASCEIYLGEAIIAPSWPKKARSLVLIVPLLVVIVALVWWIMPGTRIEESTGNAATVQAIGEQEEELRPALSRQIDGQKNRTAPTLLEPENNAESSTQLQDEPLKEDATPALVEPQAAEDTVESGVQADDPAAETGESTEEDSGGFRIHIYD